MIGADFHHDHQLERKRTPAAKGVSFSARRATLGLMLFAAFASVTASAFYRQVVETDFLKDEGAKRFLRENGDLADAGRRDVHSVSLAAGNDLRVAGDDGQVE